MRCGFCGFNNPEGVHSCQHCHSRLPWVSCARCYFTNPPDNTYCGRCGQPLAQPAEPQPQTGKLQDRKATSIVAVIGFGAVLVLASAAYPWYLLGQQATDEAAPATIFGQLAAGWQWFPGVPLVLITVSGSLSTFLSMLAHHGKAHPVPSLLLGLVTLISAIWLWQGLITGNPNPGDWELTPIMATVGAIILVVGGFLVAHPMFAR